MCGLQHAALRHAAVHVSGQHTVWRKDDIYSTRIWPGVEEVKLGFAMLQIENLDGSGKQRRTSTQRTFILKTASSHRDEN